MGDELNRRSALALATAALAGCNPAALAPLPEHVDLPGVPGVTSAMGSPLPGLHGPAFHRTATILNVWASWCPFCRGEHGQLMALARDPNLYLIGIVFRDRPEPVRDYLHSAGNPFRALGMDRDGWVARHLGQRGVPHTYVIRSDGRIIETVAGALTAQWVETKLRPAYQRAKATV